MDQNCARRSRMVKIRCQRAGQLAVGQFGNSCTMSGTEKQCGMSVRLAPQVGRPPSKKIMGWLVVIVVAVVGWMGFVLLMQRRVLYPRGMAVAAPKAGQEVAGLVRIWIGWPQERVEAWLLPCGRSRGHVPGPAVIFAHGNGELIDYWPGALEPYRQMGMTVLLPEYRGYGRSAGSPSQVAITDDFVEFFDRLAALPQVDADRIVFHGRSLGAGALCALTQKRKPAVLILESAFTSVADVAWRLGVPPLLVLDKFDNRAVVSQLDLPVLVLHGRFDQVIPVRHAHRLDEAAWNSRLILYEAGHNDGLFQRAQYWRDIRKFLDENGVLGPD